MAEYTPDQNFKHPVCRGSWAFGNNCKVCERCQATHPGRAGTQLLTNPKHTDTSRSGDLVGRLRDFVIAEDIDLAADRIEALEAENERLRGALGWYEKQANDCRKITREGDDARYALDRDGGERARAALAGDSHDQ